MTVLVRQRLNYSDLPLRCLRLSDQHLASSTYIHVNWHPLTVPKRIWAYLLFLFLLIKLFFFLESLMNERSFQHKKCWWCATRSTTSHSGRSPNWMTRSKSSRNDTLPGTPSAHKWYALRSWDWLYYLCAAAHTQHARQSHCMISVGIPLFSSLCEARLGRLIVSSDGPW
jgi:hypothetical protein